MADVRAPIATALVGWLPNKRLQLTAASFAARDRVAGGRYGSSCMARGRDVRAPLLHLNRGSIGPSSPAALGPAKGAELWMLVRGTNAPRIVGGSGSLLLQRVRRDRR